MMKSLPLWTHCLETFVLFVLFWVVNLPPLSKFSFNSSRAMQKLKTWTVNYVCKFSSNSFCQKMNDSALNSSQSCCPCEMLLTLCDDSFCTIVMCVHRTLPRMYSQRLTETKADCGRKLQGIMGCPFDCTSSQCDTVRTLGSVHMCVVLGHQTP